MILHTKYTGAHQNDFNVHAEAWTERVPGGINDLPVEAGAGADPAGKVLGRSASLELFFDFAVRARRGG